MWDILLVQQDNNLTLPEWAASVFPDQMRPLVEQGFAINTYSTYMKLIKGGPLVTKIAKQMLETQSDHSSRSIYIYSGHDLTLLSVIRLLNLTNEFAQIIDYGATLSFELHCERDDDCDQMEVKVSFEYVNYHFR